MTEMSHEAFLQLLAELEPPRAAEAGSLTEFLSPEAALHAERCEDCARTAEALWLLAVEENSLFDEPPADYWSGFEARLSARLAELPGPAAAPAPASSGRSQLLRVAALLIAVAGLLSYALRDPAEPPGAELTQRAGLQASSDAEELEDLLAAWSDEDAWDAEDPASDRAFAALGSEEALPGLFRSPTDTLHDELSLELDDVQAAELAHRLRAEISS